MFVSHCCLTSAPCLWLSAPNLLGTATSETFTNKVAFSKQSQYKELVTVGSDWEIVGGFSATFFYTETAHFTPKQSIFIAEQSEAPLCGLFCFNAGRK